MDIQDRVRLIVGQQGATLLELMITMTIMLILASATFPLTKYTGQRSRELELRQQLREMRTALDEFRRDWARDGEVMTGPLCVKNKTSCAEHTGLTGYPKSLDTLLEIDLSGTEAGVKASRVVRRYLRRIPVDPMTGTRSWGVRCHQDPPDNAEWCGADVFDVYSRSAEVALDGSLYRDW